MKVYALAQAVIQESGQGRDHEHYSDSAGAIEGDVEVVIADPAVFTKG